MLFLFIQSCGSDVNTKKRIKSNTEYPFKISIKLFNHSGYSENFTKFELHLQDKNWELIKKYMPREMDR